MITVVEWQLIREEVLRRDNHRCQKCGKTIKLIVHHKIPRKLGGMDTVDNLVILCTDCHPSEERRVQTFSKANHTTKILSISFEDTVKQYGKNGAHIGVDKNLVGKKVLVRLEIIE